ncbi:MAG: hypothetical protein A3A51_03755 [Candidatus Levybacteria bacterium RIFCSPLOWO2_01_FULL_39_10]|nr:MAG: hypothetical protein A3A51_03755 [Candidatus Levybacteria bacterium RIFCSPLOWO2_01_FULL_39_10]
MKKILSLFLFFILFFSFISPSFAQQTLKESDCTVSYSRAEGVTKGGNIATLDCIPVIVANVVYWALVFSGSVALFFVIFSGIKFLTSAGDPKKVEGARNTLIWALIGLTIIILSFAILNIISELTGVGCIKLFGFEQCLPGGGGAGGGGATNRPV